MKRKDVLALAKGLQDDWNKHLADLEFMKLKTMESKTGSEYARLAWLESQNTSREDKALLRARAAQLMYAFAAAKLKPDREIELTVARIYAPPGVRVY